MLKKNRLTAVQTVDLVEKQVYEFLKPSGFKRYGRTLGRFVDTDMFQVVNFQIITPGKINLKTGEIKNEKKPKLVINLGIRIPECTERTFSPVKNEKYYHEYDCNIRGEIPCEFPLERKPEKIANDIISELEKYVFPVFNVLSTREGVLSGRKKRLEFDRLHANMILLDEAMIYGRLGHIDKATELFNEHYRLTDNRGHLEYLETLADELGIELKK